LSTKINLILDIVIFAAFLVVDDPALTGMTIHEWLALALAATIVTHLLFHWNWLVALSRKFFKNLFHQSLLNYLVDALFFISLTAAMLSGLLISKSVMQTLGFQMNGNHAWESIHKLVADLSLLMLGLHFALHFKWVVTNLKRYFVTPLVRLFRRPRATALAIQPVRIDDTH
jgi:hypothetical protein